MPASAVRPGAAPGWQAAAAGLLFLFTAATCLQLALVANVSLLPKVRTRTRHSCTAHDTPACTGCTGDL